MNLGRERLRTGQWGRARKFITKDRASYITFLVRNPGMEGKSLKMLGAPRCCILEYLKLEGAVDSLG